MLRSLVGSEMCIRDSECVAAWDDVPAADDNILQPLVRQPDVRFRQRVDDVHQLPAVPLFGDESRVVQCFPLAIECFTDLLVSPEFCLRSPNIGCRFATRVFGIAILLAVLATLHEVVHRMSADWATTPPNVGCLRVRYTELLLTIRGASGAAVDVDLHVTTAAT